MMHAKTEFNNNERYRAELKVCLVSRLLVRVVSSKYCELREMCLLLQIV